MSERKPAEKLKSTLSADVPPFVPRNYNMELLNNAIPAQCGINHIPQYSQDTANIEKSEWCVPIIPPASSGIVFPMAPVLHADYQLQSSQENGYYDQNSKFISTKKQIPSKAKKNTPRKHLEEKMVSVANATIVSGDLFPQNSHASSEDEGRQKETPRCQNPKLKINFVRSNDKHIRIMTSHKSSDSSVKLESSTEFPSLPAPSNEDRLFSETYNSEPYELTQHSSYSSVLQSSLKHPSDLKPDSSFSNKNISITNKAKSTSQQNIHRKLKAERIPGKRHSFHEDKNKFEDTRENEQNDIFKSNAERKEHRPQYERKSISSSKYSHANTSESVMERKKHVEGSRKNNQTIDASSKKENSIIDQIHLRKSSSKNPEYITKRQKYLESRKIDGMMANSSKKKNCATGKMPSRHYGSKSVESIVEKKKYVKKNKKNNEVITDATSKEENGIINEMYLKEHSWKAESTMEKNKSSEDYRNNNQVIIDGMDEETNMTSQSTKPQKSQKRRKRNRKKKKDSLGKVALLSPEVFANITNKMNKELKINQTGSFNLSDQVDFPSLSSFPPLANDEGGTESQNADNVKKSESSVNSSSNGEKPLNMSVPNVWRPAAYSDVVQSDKAKNNEVQTNVVSMKKTYCDSKNEGILVKTSKKNDRKKKKKDNAASDNSKKTQADNAKQIKSSSLIQVSLTSMVTSLQQVKLNQMKKKETKARVISTKRGIMDKIANPHNILDASAPIRKRGKERERPGKRRISAMRKIILREREKRRSQFLEAQKCKNEDECSADKQVDINANITALSESSVDSCESENYEKVDKKLQASKIILHTRKFRDYCDHMISEEIDSTVLALLKDLIRFQDRLHEKDPIKARMKRRLVYGLREVTKHLRLCKLKCIIIAPNIENIPSEGGLSDALQVIIELAQQQNVLYLFALQRRLLGKVCMKIVPVSCVGIFNYDGAEGHYHKLLEFLTEARGRYNETLKIISAYITEEIETQLLHLHILPAAIQPIRSKVLSQIAMHNAFAKMTVSEDSKMENDTGECVRDESTGDALQRTEEISVVTN